MTTVPPLTPYPLRKIWPDEARDFTPWLARNENLARLGTAIGIGALELEEREFAVGPFSLDILARDPFGNRVIIENQLQASDHDHLGKALTYLAGSGGGLTVIWVAAAIRDQHRTALNWLNSHTPPEIHFIGVEVSAWTIGGSEPGTQFLVVAKPDSVRRGGRRLASLSVLTEEQASYRAYWSAFQDFLTAHGAQHWFRPELPKGGWWGRNLGRPGCNLYGIIRSKTASLGVMLEIEGFDLAVEKMSREKAVLDAEIGEPLTWARAAVRHQISIERSGVSISDKPSWPDQHAWLLDRMERFRRAFKDRVADFQIDQGSSDAEGPDADVNT